MAIAWLVLGLVGLVAASEGDARVADLLALQARYRDSVIPMSAKQWENFASGKSRPYSLVMYVNSKSVTSGQLATILKEMRVEYGYTAASYAKDLPKQGKQGKVFFTELEYSDETRDIFHRMAITSVPHAVHLPASTVYKSDTKVKLSAEDRMVPKTHQLPWDASAFASFVADRTGVVVDVVRPSIFRTWYWPFLAVGILASLLWLFFAITSSDFFRKNLEKIGIAGSLAIYWFATSGGLYNIIRGMPFSYPDQNTKKIVYFMNGSGQQLGAEGFMLGTLYMMFAIPLAMITFVIPRIKSHQVRDWMATALTVLMGFAVYFVLKNYTWKTGYHLHNYLFR